MGFFDSGLYEENGMLKFTCPECGEKKNMRSEDCRYRRENDLKVRCVHCEYTGSVGAWSVEHGH
ncbi:hypothetical protein [Methanonatronarchaeum sp. AMET6-2]|uniref:hypothetical protein n=1 Tax=Methanonatronarchaeum sp. AMET6-2 TaxID=2933293 RepID=UPI0011F69938|nr:hypothetical protein [Methanonatronarchaeum sp. AMET6-2]RZN62392.1 MAG: hypothetical protein EF811_02910 [Methanonatronarchaeia archaeon]UOY09634.1 hypothetical protein MU439_05095 [Methanonatronarchaeum sp. AMET6-2]